MRLPQGWREWVVAHLLVTVLMVIVGRWSLYNVIVIIILGLIIRWISRRRVRRAGV